MTRITQQPRNEWEALDNPGLTREQRLDAAARLGLTVNRTRKPCRRPLLPTWAGAVLQLFDALHEQTAATEGQRAHLADIAQGGTL